MEAAKPVNQKSVYHSFALVYEKLMNDEIGVEKAEAAVSALQGMNKTFALELKLAELKRNFSTRNLESFDFDKDK